MNEITTESICDKQDDYEPVALTVMVTFTGSLSSPGRGDWLVVGVALLDGMVRGEDARGKAMVGPEKNHHSTSDRDRITVIW